LLYHFNTISARPKTEHLASWEDLDRDVGQWGQDTGRPGIYRTVGNPRHSACSEDVKTTVL